MTERGPVSGSGGERRPISHLGAGKALVVGGKPGRGDPDSVTRNETFVQRLYHVCYMAEAAERAGRHTSAEVFVPLCKELAGDSEPEIRQALANQLPQLARIFLDGGQQALSTELLGLLHVSKALLKDSCGEVQVAAEHALIDMLQKAEGLTHLENELVEIVSTLSTSREETQRMCAANLAVCCSEGLPLGLFEASIAPEMVKLAADSEFRVRKAVAVGLPRCCEILARKSSIVVDQLLDVFVLLSEDSVWAVRTACAEGIVHIEKAVKSAAREELLAGVIERLAKDQSVRLVELYTSMADPSSEDSRLPMYCAFNFPASESDEQEQIASALLDSLQMSAVVQKLGSERWHELSTSYQVMLTCDQEAVRRSLACSLHELARILGSNLSESHLLPAFFTLSEDVDEVRLGLLKDLVKFVEVLPSKCRAQSLRLLRDVAWRSEGQEQQARHLERVVKCSSLWSLRTILAEYELPNHQQAHNIPAGRLGKITGPIRSEVDTCPFCSPTLQVASFVETIANFMAAAVVEDVAYSFDRVPVAGVRNDAARQLGGLILYLSQVSDGDVHLTSILDQTRLLSTSNNFRDRQIFVAVCSQLTPLLTCERLGQQILPSLLQLAKDKVANIRIVTARLFMEQVASQESSAKLHCTRAILHQLLQDTDRDVAFYTLQAQHLLQFDSSDMENGIGSCKEDSCTMESGDTAKSAAQPSGGCLDGNPEAGISPEREAGAAQAKATSMPSLKSDDRFSDFLMSFRAMRNRRLLIHPAPIAFVKPRQRITASFLGAAASALSGYLVTVGQQ
eukprot:SM000080S22918  [mRNA]  locus=s80:132323:138352:+ [translate_table: standard]